MAMLCQLIGHAWRTERRYSNPGDLCEVVEIVMDRRAGAMCAGAAAAHGLRPRITARVCVRCDAREAVSTKAGDAQ